MAIFQMFRDKFFIHTIGTSSPILKATHIAFMSVGRDIKDSDSLNTLTTEIDRIAISSSDMSSLSKRFTWDFTINNSSCVCPTSIITAKDSTNTVITLTTATAVFFEVGNLIEVATSGDYIESKIIAKSGDNITISSPINALVGGLVRKKVSHMIVLCNSTMTPDLVNDLCFLVFPDKFFKDGSASLAKTLAYDFQ